MTAFIVNTIDAAAAGHEFNVTRVHTDGSFSLAFVKPGVPSASPIQPHGDALVVERTDGLYNIYVKGTLQAVSENADGANKYVQYIS